MEVAGLAVGIIALTDPVMKLVKTIRRRRYNMCKGFQESTSTLIKSIIRIQLHCSRIRCHCEECPTGDMEDMVLLLTDISQRLQKIKTELEAAVPEGENINYKEYSQIKEAIRTANSQVGDCEKQLANELQVRALQSQVKQNLALQEITSQVKHIRAHQTDTLAGVETLQSTANGIHHSVRELAKEHKPASCLVHVGLLGHWRGKLERYDLTPESSIGDVIKLELESRETLPEAPLHFFAVYPRYNRCTSQGLSWVRCDHTVLMSNIERKSVDIEGQSHPIRLEYIPQSKPFSVVSIFGKGIDQHAIAIGVPITDPFNLDETLKTHIKWPSRIEELQVIRKLDADTGDLLDDPRMLLKEYWIPSRFRLCLELHVTPPIPGPNMSRGWFYGGFIAKCAEFCFSLFG